MPSITTVHESLPYIDPEPTPAERAAAEALIAMERSSIPADPHHALLPPAITPQFSSFINAELARIAQQQAPPSASTTTTSPTTTPTNPEPLRAIDLSRYQHQPPPPPHPHTLAADLEAGLSQAYTAMTYLSARRQHLALLDGEAHHQHHQHHAPASAAATLGKNAWLAANWQLEAELRAVERELAATRREIDVLTVRRQRVQGGASGASSASSAADGAAAEMRALDDGWRRGVGRVLEAEVAAEGVRRSVVEEQRRRAQGA